MPRWVRVIVWVAVFTVCAGVGAFIASRSNPFPPGVEDPGARSTTPAATPSLAQTGYLVTGTARTRHDLFVGGSCETDWTIELHVGVDDAGKAQGAGAVHLEGKLRCDFPTAQVQAEEIEIEVGGHLRGALLDLSLDPTSMLPDGSNDFGGLVPTLPRFPTMHLAHGRGVVHSTVRVSDGDQGSYVATYVMKARPGDA